MKKLIIFDLDGTLLNTIADLANSTNYALKKFGFPTHPTDDYNFFVGNGINKLLERALPEGHKTEENMLKIKKEFLLYYNEHNTDDSTPYPGICDLLNTLQSRGFMLAVASNKYEAATRKLVKYYFPGINFAVVSGQKDNVPVKPDPTIVNEIISLTGVNRDEVLYVGDSGVDMQTTKNAKVTGVGVTWGFRPKAELESFNPDHIVDSAKEILELI